MLLFRELVALTAAIIRASSFTWGMLHVINRYIPVKVTDAVQKSGLDYHIHGEVVRVIKRIALFLYVTSKFRQCDLKDRLTLTSY